MSPSPQPEFSRLDFHVMLAMASGPLYGYALAEAIAAESGGTLEPRAGSLYRVLGRLMASGLVREAEPGDDVPPHPGLARKYYSLTRRGRAALSAEARLLKRAAIIAEKRLGVSPGRS
jgi:DNA-binding PadR family transcriptional regulator